MSKISIRSASRKPITHHFLQAFERPSDAVALRFKRHKSWIDLSWQDYFRRGEAVAQGLAACGVKAGDRVAILSNTRWEWAAADFGILGVRAITVPIYQSNRPEEIEFILNHCQARVLILEDSAQLRKWEGLGKKCKSVETVICMQPSGDMPPGILAWDDFINDGFKAYADQPDFFARQIAKTKLSDVATLVYTSGTTGEPKAAVLTHLQIISEVEALVMAFPISPKDSTLSFLPYAHVLGRVELWLHTYLGFTLSFAESIERLRANLLEISPTVILGVPRIFEKIFSGVMTEIQSSPWRQSFFTWMEKAGEGWLSPLVRPPRQLLMDRLLYSKLREGLGGRLRFSVSGGAPLETQIATFFYRANILILEGYGLTESTAAITVNTPSAFEFGTVGRPLNEVDIQIADDGEILVKSDKIMTEYYADPEATASVFREGYFCTGDIGEWTAGGFLKITDRKKDLIKTAGGKYVAPQKLEGMMKLDPLISNVLIHGDRKKFIVALLTLDESVAKKYARGSGLIFRDYKSLIQTESFREHVRKIVAQVNTQLASYETIKNFAILDHDFTVENGELTPSLKVKRRVCDERYHEILEGLY